MATDARLRCKHCGHPNLGHAKFCAKCGKSLVDQLTADLHKKYHSTNDSEEAFESGKEFYKLEKYADAQKAFEKAIQLEPNHVEYQEWLAKTLLKLEKYQEVLKVASKALEINPNSSVALWVRARAKTEVQDVDGAFLDVSKSIGLNPEDFEAVAARKVIYYENQDWENGLYDALRYHELRGDIRLYSTGGYDPTIKTILETANQHIKQKTYPLLRANGERLVDYWVVLIEWGRQMRPKVFDTHTSYHAYSTLGAGYVCISDQNLRIISLGQLGPVLKSITKKGAAGFLGDVFTGVGGGVVEHQEVSSEDQVWTIPNETLLGAQTSNGQVLVSTAVMKWQLLPAIDPPLLAAAINMAMTGKLARTGLANKKESEPKPRDDVITLLKQLGELRDSGIITQAEFDQKKAELLRKL